MQLLLAMALLMLAASASARPGAPTQQYGTPEAAPYPTSGWRPVGRQFFLPSSSRTAGLYEPPPQEYGPPAPGETTTTELPTTTAQPVAEQQRQAEEVYADTEAGVYYLLGADGRLQRVSYAHGPAPEAYSLLPERLSLPGGVDSGFLVRFHYQDLLPQGVPIFSYRQGALRRVN